ncbi:hypothetical protein ACF08M_26230 [Streptomyces sp. NPDC015032]|uniref:hypothetical protein n=1 Tax=Streptomyces sp. NPDC015032 TaxID=3364937 RepID=UPI00370105F8
MALDDFADSSTFGSEAASRPGLFCDGRTRVDTAPDLVFRSSDDPELADFVDAVRF